MRVVDKAFAYVTHGDRLLVFRHPNAPEVGLQVPAGTIAPGERPDRAALREAREETGLGALALRAELGARDFDATPYGRDELHRRRFFHVIARGDVPETWTHREMHASDGSGPIPFDFFWVGLPDGVPALFAGHDALLPELVRRGWRP